MHNWLENFKKITGETIGKFFDRERLNELARKTGFTKRASSKLEGFEIIEVLSGDTVTDPYISYEGMCSQIEELNPSAGMTPQALEQRINSTECVEYMKTVFEETLNQKLPLPAVPAPDLLDHFGKVYIEDSTTVTLHEKLTDEFKGSGGSASTAAVKVDLIYEMKEQEITEIAIREGAEPDQSMAGAMNHLMKPGDLRISDLGYFSVASIMEANAAGSFILSRLLKSCNVYLNEDDSEPVNLPKYIKKNFPEASIIDMTVYIGKEERFEVRLVGYRLHPEIASARKREIKQKARKKGRNSPSKDYLAWQEFSFLITNVPEEIWPAKVIGTIYRIRWQIELIFKGWKSLLHIHVLRGFRPERIKCLIYGKLIAALLMTRSYSYAARVGWYLYEREVSFFKMIGWLKRNMRFKRLFYAPEEILEALERELKRLKKQKRKRKTTLELIEYEVGYQETLDERMVLASRQKDKK